MQSAIKREVTISSEYASGRTPKNAAAIAAAKRLYDQEKTNKNWKSEPHDFNLALGVSRYKEIGTIVHLIGCAKWRNLQALKARGVIDGIGFYETLCDEITR